MCSSACAGLDTASPRSPSAGLTSSTALCVAASPPPASFRRSVSEFPFGRPPPCVASSLAGDRHGTGPTRRKGELWRAAVVWIPHRFERKRENVMTFKLLVAALAIAGIAGSSLSAEAKTMKRHHHKSHMSSMKSSGTAGSAITTGSGAPANKPNLSSSSQTSDTSRTK